MAEVHVLVVPFPAEGHINGMLRFAQVLAAHEGLLVTFGYPARCHALAHTRNKLAHSASVRVEVVPDGLPTDENQALDYHQMLASMPIMQSALQLLLDKSAPSLPPISCIISDTFLPWTQDLADKAGLPRVDFWTSTAAVYNMLYHIPELISRGHLPLNSDELGKWVVEARLVDFLPGLPPFPVTELPHELVQISDMSDARIRFMLEAGSRARDADRILVHSLHELESEVFNAMQADGLPIYPVGPLFDTTSSSGSPNSECLQWLDKQEAASVVYVALGTMAMLTLTEVHAMALGLEASGCPFLWVLRRDCLINGSLSESLPEGFLERTVAGGRGFIVSWAPQMEVLRHPSVVAFFSHCGWNSTLECVWEGLPMVACPRAAEQRSNAKSIVEKWKIGVEVERQEDGSFTREAVQEAVQAIVENQGAKERALHFKEVARRTIEDGGTSHSNLVRFVEHLRHLPRPHS